MLIVKMEYSPRSENNILPLLKDINVNSKMDYLSKTVKELRHIARQRGVVGYSRLRKADLIAVISIDVRPRSTLLDDWLRGRLPERYNRDVNDTVNNSLMDAPVPVIETPILVPKPFVSRSTVGKIYDKTTSVINKFAKWIEGAIPEEPIRVVNEKLEELKAKVRAIFGKIAKNKLEIRETNSVIKGFTKQYTIRGTQGVDAKTWGIP